MAKTWIAKLAQVLASNRSTVVSGTEDAAELYAASLLAEIREEVDRADKKAQTLLAGSGVAIGALLAGLIAGRWSPFELANSVEWLWWAGVIAASGGVSILALAVYPRTRRRGPEKPMTISYFGDVAKFATTAELKKALTRSSTASLDRLADQIRQVSFIVNRKYRLIQKGIWLLLLAATFCSTSVLINTAIV